MVNFGLLTAGTHPVVWGTPANFNGFRVLFLNIMVAERYQIVIMVALCNRADHYILFCACFFFLLHLFTFLFKNTFSNVRLPTYMKLYFTDSKIVYLRTYFYSWILPARGVITSPRRRNAKYCYQHVCMSVCPLQYPKTHMSMTFSIQCYLWPWLGPSLTTMQYVMYFRFCGWRHDFT